MAFTYIPLCLNNSAAAVLRTPPPHDHAYYATGNTNARARCTEISIPKCDRHI